MGFAMRRARPSHPQISASTPTARFWCHFSPSRTLTHKGERRNIYGLRKKDDGATDSTVL